jgi:hypothetical protein
MTDSERITRLEQEALRLATEHEALYQVSAALLAALPFPPQTVRALLTASYDSMRRQLEGRDESAVFQQQAAECHDTLSKMILDA